MEHQMNCKLHDRPIFPTRGLLPSNTICKDINCSPPVYNGPIAALPKGPGGLIFVQNNSDIGQASYHFQTKPFVNYENTDLSNIFPAGHFQHDTITHGRHKYFENWKYQIETRTFLGDLIWTLSPSDLPLEIIKWKYTIVFNKNFSKIESGEVVHLNDAGSITHKTFFSQEKC